MKREVRKGKYRHFKGSEYEVVDTARCSETDATYVVYRALYDTAGGLWIRPVDMFLEHVERDGRVVERFSYMGES